MGTPPDDPKYEPGDECPTCNISLFGGVTPKYVEAELIGVTQCPAFPAIPPNGIYLLTQSAPCIWQAAVGIWLMRWSLLEISSGFRINSHPFEAFFHFPLIVCHHQFTNQRLVCGGTNAGVGGFANIFWGPTIGP